MIISRSTCVASRLKFDLFWDLDKEEITAWYSVNDGDMTSQLKASQKLPPALGVK